MAADGGGAREDYPVTIDSMAGNYKRSKFQAELVALDRARKGVPIVIVNPTAPVGERDVNRRPPEKSS